MDLLRAREANPPSTIWYNDYWPSPHVLRITRTDTYLERPST